MEKLLIYCDGGCRGNQDKNNIGGWGVLLKHGELEKTLYGGVLNTTNNKMELLACIKGLEAIKNKGAASTQVISDSQYLIKGMNEWIDGWKRKGWRNSQKKPVENKELWLRIDELRSQFRDIEFIHCKGHADNEGNNRADELANLAMDELGGKQ